MKVTLVKVVVCSWLQRKNFARAKHDLESIHNNCEKKSVYEVTSASVIQKVRQRLANIDPNVTAGQWLETV